MSASQGSASVVSAEEADMNWRRQMVGRLLCLTLLVLGATCAVLHSVLPIIFLPLLALHLSCAGLALAGLVLDHYRPQNLPLLCPLALLYLWIFAFELLSHGRVPLQFLTILIPLATKFCYDPGKAWLLAVVAVLIKEAALWAFLSTVALQHQLWALTSDTPPIAVHNSLLLAISLGAGFSFLHLLMSYAAPRTSPSPLEHMLQLERTLNRELVRNILPLDLAEDLLATFHSGGLSPLAGGMFKARTHIHVSVAFADIVGFTKLSALCTPQQLVSTLDSIFCAFDEASTLLNVEKIKTIGDCYMCAAIPREEEEAASCASAVLQLCATMHSIIPDYTLGQRTLTIRAGMHCGTVTAGIIGKTKFCYDIWGDTVNTASRMESTGLVGGTQITEMVHSLLGDTYTFTSRGPVEVRGKGTLHTWIHWPNDLMTRKRGPSNRSATDVLDQNASFTEVANVPCGLRSMFNTVVQESVGECSTMSNIVQERQDMMSPQAPAFHRMIRDFSTESVFGQPPSRLGGASSALGHPFAIPPSHEFTPRTETTFSSITQQRNNNSRRLCFQCP